MPPPPYRLESSVSERRSFKNNTKKTKKTERKSLDDTGRKLTVCQFDNGGALIARRSIFPTDSLCRGNW